MKQTQRETKVKSKKVKIKKVLLSESIVINTVNDLPADKFEVIGFDLCEVATPQKGDWDLNVGARMLYKLCCVSAST